MQVGWVSQVPRPDWDDLWDRTEGATPFQTWAWHEAFRTCFGGRPRILAVAEGDELLALHSYAISYGLGKVARPFLWGPTDDLRPLVAPDLWGAFFAFASEAIKREADLWDLGEMESSLSFREAPIALQDVEQRAAKERSKPQSVRLLLDLPDSFDAYLAGLSKSLRTDVRRALSDESQLIRPGGVEDLEILFDLHAARWRKRGLPGVFGRKTRAFHRELWRLAPEIPELWILEREGSAVGALYALKGKGATYFYQSGFDPAARKHSPGTALVAHAIAAAIERGDQWFDFCRGDEPYKRRWKPTHEIRQHRHVIAFNGLGRQQMRWVETVYRAELRLRERFEGRSLWKK